MNQVNQVNQELRKYTLSIKGKEYITSDGLKFLMEQRYGVGKFCLQVHVPSGHEMSMFKGMLGGKVDDGYVIMRGEVWVVGIERPFVDYGTAHRQNMRGMVNFDNYPIEMASRRALNRAMRLATNADMCSVDELPDRTGDGTYEDYSPINGRGEHGYGEHGYGNNGNGNGNGNSNGYPPPSQMPSSNAISPELKQMFVDRADQLVADGVLDAEQGRSAKVWIEDPNRTEQEVWSLLNKWGVKDGDEKGTEQSGDTNKANGNGNEVEENEVPQEIEY